MMSGMDLEEESSQMETTLLGNGKKEWEMDGADMFTILNQTSRKLLILNKRWW